MTLIILWNLKCNRLCKRTRSFKSPKRTWKRLVTNISHSIVPHNWDDQKLRKIKLERKRKMAESSTAVLISKYLSSNFKLCARDFWTKKYQPSWTSEKIFEHCYGAKRILSFISSKICLLIIIIVVPLAIWLKYFWVSLWLISHKT